MGDVIEGVFVKGLDLGKQRSSSVPSANFSHELLRHLGMSNMVVELVLSVQEADLGEQGLLSDCGGLFEMGFLLSVLGSNLGHEVFA